MLPIGLALKLGWHPVAIAQLSLGTSSLLVSQIRAGGSTDAGREYTNVLHFFPMFYVCIVTAPN
jgi:hypothetical protein